MSGPLIDHDLFGRFFAAATFAGFHFPPDVIVLAVRWYLRFGLSYRDVEELLTERGIEVDHVTGHRHHQDHARGGRHRQGGDLPDRAGRIAPGGVARTDRYANNHIEADHGQLKLRLGPMRGLKQDRSAKVVIAGHAFVQNVRRGHYEPAVEEPVTRRVGVAFDELALAI